MESWPDHARDMISATTGPWQFIALLTITITITLCFYMWTRRGVAIDTEKRKHERDNEQSMQDYKIAEVTRTASGIGASLDAHVKALTEIDVRMDALEKNVIYKAEFMELNKIVTNIDKNMAVLIERIGLHDRS